MSFKVPCLPHRTLDDVLEYFGFERRDPEELHSALNDCRQAAKVYMKLVEVPDPKKNPTLGFCRE
jgi:DNA polymerase III epsilon subunit-like protein